jgi:hypothetical protein
MDTLVMHITSPPYHPAFVGVAPEFNGLYKLIAVAHQQTGDNTRYVVGVR